MSCNKNLTVTFMNSMMNCGRILKNRFSKEIPSCMPIHWQSQGKKHFWRCYIDVKLKFSKPHFDAIQLMQRIHPRKYGLMVGDSGVLNAEGIVTVIDNQLSVIYR